MASDILPGMESTSLYVHIPFCKQRCGYCDFNAYAGIDALIPSYVDALCREVDWIASTSPERLPVHTIYFGGGTPSLLNLEQVKRILCAIREDFILQPNLEVTVEVNPGTTSRDYLSGLRELGINRLSIGMQSANDIELHLLGRIHSYSEVINTVAWGRAAGFDNINLDLIYGIPAQSLDDWYRSLHLALGLHPEHFSLYALTLEDHVILAQWLKRGLVREIDTDLAADMYELAESLLAHAAYESYEISNWAKQDGSGKMLTCQHNMQYWRGKPYLGFGSGAHGYINHVRMVNVLSPHEYITRIQEAAQNGDRKLLTSPANLEFQILSHSDEMGEFMMMGLRLTQEGVSEKCFLERFGISLEAIFGNQINRMIGLNLLEWVVGLDRRLRLTRKGRLLGNIVFREFI